MGISTYRIFAIILMVNMILGATYAMYENPRDYDENIFDEQDGIGTDLANTGEDSGGTVVSDTLQEEGSVVDTAVLAIKVLGILIFGFIALPLAAGTYTSDTVVRITAQVLQYLWIILYGLLAIKIIAFFKNRDTQ